MFTYHKSTAKNSRTPLFVYMIHVSYSRN